MKVKLTTQKKIFPEKIGKYLDFLFKKQQKRDKDLINLMLRR